MKQNVLKVVPFFEANLSQNVKEEWMMKEYGSWEDHKKPESGHPYTILTDSPKGKIVCKTKEDAEIIYKSAIYQTSWDSDDPEVQRLEKSAGRLVKLLRAKLN